jgi:hypothetical protein
MKELPATITNVSVPLCDCRLLLVVVLAPARVEVQMGPPRTAPPSAPFLSAAIG